MANAYIPSEWVNWISENLRNGCSVESLTNIMAGKGFNVNIALEAISNIRDGKSIAEHKPDLATAQVETASGFVYEAARVPMDVNYIDTNDKRVYIAAKVERPVILVLDDLFTPAECDQLIALSRGKMQASKVVDNDTGQEALHKDRTSSGTFFNVSENAFIATLDRRIADVMHWPIENGEGIQILNYQPGAEYTAHFDYFPYEVKGSQKHLATGGQRVATLIMYLNEVEQGGETAFPNIGVNVVPKKGSAVYFEYCNSQGQVDPLTLHAGLPVIKGEKWIATKWMRQHKYS